MNAYQSAKYIQAAIKYPFKSVSVGMEKGINAKDCPFCRLDPVSTSKLANDNVNNDIYIYIGIDKKNSDFEEIPKTLFEIADNVILNLPLGVTFDNIEMDDGTLPNLRLARILVKHNTFLELKC